jgi:hypothetical protein
VPSQVQQLIPPPELAPPSIKHLPVEKRIQWWATLVDEGDALIRAGLRSRIGEGGNLQAAYQAWYDRYLEEHDRQLIAFAENLTRRERANGK